MILVDDDLTGIRGAPPPIDGFRPDVYVAPTQRNVLILGEAETARDLERQHTVAQLLAFLRYGANYQGAILVVAVPWHVVRSAKSLLRFLRSHCPTTRSIEVVVLEQLEG